MSTSYNSSHRSLLKSRRSTKRNGVKSVAFHQSGSSSGSDDESHSDDARFSDAVDDYRKRLIHCRTRSHDRSGADDITSDKKDILTECSLQCLTRPTNHARRTPDQKGHRHKKTHTRRIQAQRRSRVQFDGVEPLAMAEQQQQQHSPLQNSISSRKKNKQKTFSFGSPARHQRNEEAGGKDRPSNRRQIKHAKKINITMGPALGMVAFNRSKEPKLKGTKQNDKNGDNFGNTGCFSGASMETARKKKRMALQKTHSGRSKGSHIGGGNTIPIPGRNALRHKEYDDDESMDDVQKEPEVFEIDDSDESEDHHSQSDKYTSVGRAHTERRGQMENDRSNEQMLDANIPGTENRSRDSTSTLTPNAKTVTIDDDQSTEESVDEYRGKTKSKRFESSIDDALDYLSSEKNDDGMTSSVCSNNQERRNICSTPPSPTKTYIEDSTLGDVGTKMIVDIYDEQSAGSAPKHDKVYHCNVENTSCMGDAVLPDNSSVNRNNEVEMLSASDDSDHCDKKRTSPRTPTSSPPKVPNNRTIMHGGEYHAVNSRISTRNMESASLSLSKANNVKRRRKQRGKKKKGCPIRPGDAIRAHSLSTDNDDINSFSSSTPLSTQEFSEPRQDQSLLHSIPSLIQSNNTKRSPIDTAIQRPYKIDGKEKRRKMEEEHNGSTPPRAEQKSPFQEENKEHAYRSQGVDASSFHKKSVEKDFRGGPSQSSETKSRSKKRVQKRKLRSSEPKPPTEVIDIVDSSSSEGEENSSDLVSKVDKQFKSSKDGQAGDDAQTLCMVQQPQKRPHTFGNGYELDATRIAFGKQVISSGCKLRFHLGGANPRLTIEYKSSDPSSETHCPHQKVEHAISITDSSIKEMRYFLAKDDDDSDSDVGSGKTSLCSSNLTKEGAEVFPEKDQMSFLAMRVDPTDTNNLQMYTNAHDHSAEAKGDAMKFIVIELRSNDEFKKVLCKMQNNDFWHQYLDGGLTSDATNEYLVSLKEDDKMEEQRRLSYCSPQRKMRTRSSTRKKVADTNPTDILLVYPFTSDTEILEDATCGLKEASGDYLRLQQEGNKYDTSDGSQETGKAATKVNSSKKVTGRNHYLTIRGEDFDRLEPGEFLNDTLIDFWMRWIWRQEIHDCNSVVHFFTSHFFTTLREDGPEAVSSWTAKKNIDIFKKRFVFLPINESLHWSLCVVVNPGSIKDDEKDVNIPCIIFLDSLRAHRKMKVARYVREWLNFEWVRTKQDGSEQPPFKRESMPVYDPKIPYQDNSWDCGVFVCRYAYGLYQRRHRRFTVDDLNESSSRLSDKAITKSPEFDFDTDDIVRLREEIRTLVERLSAKYIEMKNREKQERRARAAKKSQASSSI